MRQRIKHYSITIITVLAVLAAGAGAFIYSGLYNVGADDPHVKPIFALMQTLRDRSIQMRSKDIEVPNLNDEQLILKGAGQYAAMCTGCHLKPGMDDSEIRPGLYPQPPDLSRERTDPKSAFWVIKHGIKMSAMPAWGGNHDDEIIWSMVAFLQKLPNLSMAQYKDMVAKAPMDEDMGMGTEDGHSHRHGKDTDEGAHSARSMKMPAMPTGHGSSAEDGHGHDHAHPAHSSDGQPKTEHKTKAPL